MTRYLSNQPFSNKPANNNYRDNYGQIDWNDKATKGISQILAEGYTPPVEINHNQRPVPNPFGPFEDKNTCVHAWEQHAWEPLSLYCPYCASTKPTSTNRR